MHVATATTGEFCERRQCKPYSGSGLSRRIALDRGTTVTHRDNGLPRAGRRFTGFGTPLCQEGVRMGVLEWVAGPGSGCSEVSAVGVELAMASQSRREA